MTDLAKCADELRAEVRHNLLAVLLDVFFTRSPYVEESNIMANAQPNGLTEADIAEAAANPASFSVEGLSQSNRSVSELIAADKYLRGRRLMSRGHSPFAGLISHAIAPGPSGRF